MQLSLKLTQPSLLIKVVKLYFNYKYDLTDQIIFFLANFEKETGGNRSVK